LLVLPVKSQIPSSLLKKSIVELYEEEKHRKIISNDLNSHNFVSKKWYFALFKAHQFSFSTGCFVYETIEPQGSSKKSGIKWTSREYEGM
jgi:hypothetical protein